MKIVALIVCLSVWSSVSAAWAAGPAALFKSDFSDPRCVVCKSLYEGLELMRSHGMSMEDGREVVLKMYCSGVAQCEGFFKKMTDKIFEQMKNGKNADEGCKNIFDTCK